MRAVVKLTWEKQENWQAALRTVDQDGFHHQPLPPGTDISFEITGERRCIGYAPAIGEREPCPGFREPSDGKRCAHCEQKDIFTDYVRGNRALDTDDDFSVYLAQCGQDIKVGVTRSDRLEKRWVEQGADYACEIHRGLSPQDALDREAEIADSGIPERIRKEAKIHRGEQTLATFRDRMNREAEIIDIQQLTAYPPLDCNQLRRNGRFAGPVKTVKGQILADSHGCVTVSSGKIIEKPSQQGLDQF